VTKKIPLLLISIICIGVAYQSVKLGVGSLYAKAAENELRSLPVSLSDDGIADTNELKGQFVSKMIDWVPDSPQYQILAGYYQSYMGRLYNDQSLIDTGLESMKNSAELRPLWPDSYIQQAYLRSNEEAPLDSVIHMIDKASHVGPYEKSTAEAIMRIYFSKWKNLKARERTQASRVVLGAQKHGINYWELREFISRYEHKNRICNLLGFNGIQIKECK
jgi:hypothetical protein